jgi:chromate reductase
VHILGISGSLKRSSANSALVRAVAAAAAAPDDIEVWDRLGDLPHFSPDDDGREPVASLRAAITRADVVLVATPEYAGGMPGSLKNALDWLVGTGELYEKPVAILSAAPSPERGSHARQWVEDVVRMQGGHVVDSFTVTTSDDPGAVLTRVLDAFSAARH